MIFYINLNRQNLLHVETLNMMTKYQLVYVKLETAILKILATIKARRQLRVRRVFHKLKANAQHYRAKQNNKRRLVLLKFRSTLERLFDTAEHF